MARRCPITGKATSVGNNVSHANNRTKRRFYPNLQERRLYSELLGRKVRLRLTTSAIRTLDKYGGLDGYLLKTPDRKLDPELVRLKARIVKARREQEAGEAPSQG